MSWRSIIAKANKDLTEKPKGLKLKGSFLTPEGLAESRSKYDDYFMFNSVTFKKELGEIVAAMQRLGIKVSFAALVDERYAQEDNDGLYNYDEKSGLAVKVEMGDMERTLYFIIEREGYYGEEGQRPQVYVPRVLEDEDTFVKVVLQTMNIGGGPVKDPSSSIRAEEQDAYRDWWYSLPREEREDADSKYPPPVFDSDYRGPRN